jgi:2-keto-3-deoxy-L-rhamnonate aldolase RhmA
MVETPDGTDNVEEIAGVAGVDAVFVGPADLALSFGVEREDQENVGRIALVKAACDRQGIPTGIATSSVSEARNASADGFAMVALPSDAVLLARSCATLLAEVRNENAD